MNKTLIQSIQAIPADDDLHCSLVNEHSNGTFPNSDDMLCLLSMVEFNCHVKVVLVAYLFLSGIEVSKHGALDLSLLGIIASYESTRTTIL